MNLKNGKIPKIMIDDSKVHDVEFYKLKEKTRFTEYEIVMMWNSFKKDLPNGCMTKDQLFRLVKKIFPRSDHEMVTENIYIIFDPEGTGLIGFDQLLLAFSMSMKGTGVTT
ncbi:neurocalcin-delta B [Eurytemora carolleeae]|uniref:neurocalcin-delta B n=1 Tax=Eurytemora carolleeae TaxID=1294199 RepID=UPI000C776437|nr:neurocalcin-delta B [Eurytemora carolleeae]|eukprot:XP_023324570.1 neurocalcin-delta B-like [Eurytemora affinis]